FITARSDAIPSILPPRIITNLCRTSRSLNLLNESCLMARNLKSRGTPSVCPVLPQPNVFLTRRGQRPARVTATRPTVVGALADGGETCLVTKYVAVGWFPAGELERARSLWPDLLADWDVSGYAEYCHEVDRHLRQLEFGTETQVLL